MSTLRTLTVVVLLVLIILGLWKIPQVMVEATPGYDSVKREDVPKLVDQYRKTLAQVVGGLVLLAGLFFTWRTLQLNREGQVTERFTRAIDQLGATGETGNGDDKKRMEIRLGGIYALERIARDSERDHEPIMEILTAYVRSNYPRIRLGTTLGPDRPDLDAILTIIARRQHKEDNPLDLHGTDLSGADLSNASLSRANLKGTNLSGADLIETDLSDADLSGAILQNAHLREADLKFARLDKADLQFADLASIKNWKKIKAMNLARAYGVTNAPQGFQKWVERKGAIVNRISDTEWLRRKGEA